MRFYLESYGCSLNAADADMIVSRLRAMGGQRVPKPDVAEVIIMNTCGVKAPTEDRIIYRLAEFSHQTRPVIVTGCLPRISLSRIESTIPSFAALLGPQSIGSLGTIMQRVLAGERNIVCLSSDKGSKFAYFEGPPDSVICTIPVCEGCLGDCAYCAVKLARGRVKSYPIEEIRRVTERSVHLGYREIRLTAQDLGAFGKDTGESIVKLLAQLDQIEGDHVYRLGMFNPNLILDTLPELLKVTESEHFFKFFHVPVQSGSDRVLRLMNRRYSSKDWIDVVAEIRRHFPESTVATDIIVGFPGESNQDFTETMQLVETAKPDLVNISKYGDRPNTASLDFDDKVRTEVKKQRSSALSALVQAVTSQSNRQWIGWSGPVLVSEKGSHGGMMGRNQSYRPVIINQPCSLGSRVQVRIGSSSKTHLLAQILP